MKWINVKEKLPKDDKLKIIRYSSNGNNVGIALSRYYTPSNNPNIKVWGFEFQATGGLKVSHWCSIPKEPS